MQPQNKAPSDWAIAREQQTSYGTANNTTKIVNYKTVSMAANGRWVEILTHYGIAPEYLTKRHGPCPACGGKDRFRFDNKDGHGSYFCNQKCGAGDGFQLLQVVNSYSASEALHLVASYLGFGSDVAPARAATKQPISTSGDIAPVIDAAIQKANQRLWSASVAVSEGDPVDLYLRHTRGLNLAVIPDGLRYHSNTAYYNQKGALVDFFPAMLAQVTNASGQVVSVHKTHLNYDGTKADLSPNKKLSRTIYRGALAGAAVKLFEAGPTLAVCEGLETALAVHLLADEYLPVWAAVSAHGLETLVVPPVVQNLLICADHDERGLQAAERLAQMQTAKGVSCKILTPETVNSDWLDELLREA